ncbi:sporulation protein YpjB [Salipaludibacillus sp. LMS25]|jgi:sporulation protein YpjB|uniref:sporulation protein YpjB n=1 Tax=Salipaludibacillus sp. LMS25 TaxID=2924031 RepID=UPI0020D1EBCF|nr:sporulation protein YpjB [Salipaludibacillus sp. LMS25]UTR14651.1 sporulation protein YpjB [Salipaludibacillus sp. LMS25]
MTIDWMKKISILCVLIILCLDFTVGANQDHNWVQLNRSTDTILKYVKDYHYEEALQQLENFSDEFLQLERDENDLTMTELQVITATYEDAVKAVKRTSLSHEARVREVYKLRLLTDVFSNHSAPLWQQTEPLFQNELSKMSESVSTESSPQETNITRLIAYYKTVEPAWRVSLSDSQFQRLHSQVVFLKKMSEGTPSKAEWKKHIALLQDSFSEVFEGKNVEEDTDPSLYWFIITVSSAVFSGLTYAGWKKYAGHKARKKYTSNQKSERG